MTTQFELPTQRADEASLVVQLAERLRRLARCHEELARELFSRAGYWRADQQAVEHAAAARLLLADAEALERYSAAVGGVA